MRILLIILQYAPDVNSNGLLFSQIAAALVGRGHQVTVVTTFPHYQKFRIEPPYRGKLAQREMSSDGVDVLRLYVYTHGRKQRFVDRFLSYFSFSTLAMIAALLLRREYDVILCPNGGFLTAVAAALVGRIRHIPMVLNIQDLYPETPIRTGHIRNPYVIRALRWLERFVYRRSAHVTVITPAFQKFVVNSGVVPEHVSVVPNFVNTEVIRPLPRDNDFSRKLGLSDRFVISHAGNIGYAYDLETMIDAADALREHPDILFLIVGDGVLKPMLEQKVRALQLANVRFLPYQPLGDVPWLRASSDVQVSLNRPGASQHSMPSKVYEIMASARPLLASADQGSDLAALVEEAQCGLVVQPRDAAALAAAVLRLYRSPSLRTEMGARGRHLAEAQYSLKSVAHRYEELLAEVTGLADRFPVQEPATAPVLPAPPARSRQSIQST